MTEVIFYEKPGCIGNARQKRLLAELGHCVRVYDLLNTRWRADELRSFFGGLPVPAWFNPTAPRVRDGEIDIDGLDEAAALTLLLSDPILIRRPLIDSPHGRCAGFLQGPVLSSLGVPAEAAVLDTCARDSSEPSCDAQAAACRSETGRRPDSSRPTNSNWEAGAAARPETLPT